ncbi:MAG TPA: hypothetical protein VKV96_11420 [Roseiarcus sp.]|nr:hypothetical protein [Roseiarcus sp.]
MEVGMVASLGAVLIIGVALAATLALRAGRRALAGGLVGEIAEILDIIDSHDLERALAAFGEGRSAAPMLPRLSCVVFKAGATRMPILGAHAGRLSAAFYASIEALNEELTALPAALPSGRETQTALASARLRRTVELGEESLCALRDIVSRRRHDLIARA